MAQTIKLPPARKTMARSMLTLFAHIATSDAKAASSGRPATIIFPTSDTALLDAIALVQARLNAVL